MIRLGNGDNTIYGNTPLGGEGDTSGNNLIVGGTGNDTIYGNYAQWCHGSWSGWPTHRRWGWQRFDLHLATIACGAEASTGSILIASATIMLETPALLSVLDEWTTTRPVSARVANISGTGIGTETARTSCRPMMVEDDDATDNIYSDAHGKDSCCSMPRPPTSSSARADPFHHLPRLNSVSNNCAGLVDTLGRHAFACPADSHD